VVKATIGLVTYVGSSEDMEALLHGHTVMHWMRLRRSIEQVTQTIRDALIPAVTEAAQKMNALVAAFGKAWL
jgi:hypothetical protein